MITLKTIELLGAAGISGGISLSVPPKLEMGDLAFACFDAAKAKEKNPATLCKREAGGL